MVVTGSDFRSSARYKRLRAQFFKAQGRVGVCHICGDSVDMSLDGRSRWGKTVDHVVPSTVGLVDPLDTSNWKLAHNRCNKLKGMGPAGPDRPRAYRADLTPGDPAYCWRLRDGLWHHFNPIHNIGDCEWPDCPRNAEYVAWKAARR